VPKWTDFGNIWNTMRELDVNAIRDESEHPATDRLRWACRRA